MKQKYSFIALLLLLIAGVSCAFDMPTLDDEGRLWDIFDDMGDMEDEIFESGFLDSISLDTMQTRKIKPSQLLPQLADLGVFDLLDIDFYCHTNPFVKRSVLDLPLFEVHMCETPYPWVVGFHLFWNHMNRSVFCCGKDTNISSYLNLNQDTLIGKIESLLNDPLLGQFAKDFSDLLEMVDFNEIIQLFGSFTVEQRRTGVMMHAWWEKHRHEIRLLLPFYYQERNIFAEPSIQGELERRFGVLDRSSQEQFEKNHAISDRLGLGDLRFEYDYAFYKTEETSVQLGLMATLPTYATVTKGIRGTTFETERKQPTLDLQSLLDLICLGEDVTVSAQDQAIETLVGDVCRNKNGFLLGALDRLNAILLDTTLGNHRHFGFGPLFRARTLLSAFLEEFKWSEHISFNTRVSLEFFTPSTETRFFALRNTEQDIDSRDFSSTNDEIAATNLTFIEQELINKFYPIALQTRVQPGLIFHVTNRWCFSAEVWDFNIGSDIWIQTQEKFDYIKTPSRTIADAIDVENARAPFAYQFKYYGSLGFKVKREDHMWLFGLNAEGTTWNKGIGDDYTVSLNIEANF